MQHAAQGPGTGRRGAVLTNRVVEHDQPHGIVLAGGEIGQRSRQELRVLKLRDLARAEAHRRARIEQDHESRVRLADEALDVRAVGARIHVPVDETRIVAFRVGAILGELLAEAEKRRPVHAGQKPFDDGARDEIEIGEPREGLGVQQVLSRRGPCGHFRQPVLACLCSLATCCTSSVSTLSVSMPSDSAK